MYYELEFDKDVFSDDYDIYSYESYCYEHCTNPVNINADDSSHYWLKFSKDELIWYGTPEWGNFSFYCVDFDDEEEAFYGGEDGFLIKPYNSLTYEWNEWL